MSFLSKQEREELINAEMLLGSSYAGAVFIVDIIDEILENFSEGKVLNDDGDFVDIQ
jgi:hypothetical protein